MYPEEKERKYMKIIEANGIEEQKNSMLAKFSSVNIELVSTCNLAYNYTITDKFQNSIVGAQRMMPWHLVKSIMMMLQKLEFTAFLAGEVKAPCIDIMTKDDKLYTFPDVLAYAVKRNS